MFTKIFQTIAVDNGSEFADYSGMERSIGGGKRTKVYYCHPYSSYERGSNENLNKIIRRWYPKGVSFANATDADIAKVENRMNNYPRGIFGYDTSAERYIREISLLSFAMSGILKKLLCSRKKQLFNRFLCIYNDQAHRINTNSIEFVELAFFLH